MTNAPREHHAGLLVFAGEALGLSQGQLGERLGVSRRTINRWGARGTKFSREQATILATLLYPVNRDLAIRIAGTQGDTLESLGLERPASPDPPRYLVDVVVCAAAEALDVSPRAMRPALLAAFRRAGEAGLTLEQMERALSPPGKPGGATRAK